MNCKRAGHNAARCPQAICLACGKRGHLRSHFPGRGDQGRTRSWRISSGHSVGSDSRWSGSCGTPPSKVMADRQAGGNHVSRGGAALGPRDYKIAELEVTECNDCGQVGHKWFDCPTAICVSCKWAGHTSVRCPQVNADAVAGTDSTARSEFAVAVEEGDQQLVKVHWEWSSRHSSVGVSAGRTYRESSGREKPSAWSAASRSSSSGLGRWNSSGESWKTDRYSSPAR